MLNRAEPGPKVLEAVSSIFKSGDAAFANLEVPLTDATTLTGRKSAAELKRRDQFILKASPLHAPFLREAGISAVSLGNNHCMDYGPDGLSEMQNALEESGLKFAGAGNNLEEAAAVQVVQLKSGLRIGLLSAMAFMTQRALDKTTPAEEFSAGVNTLSFGGLIGPKARASLATWIRQARAQSDYVIVGVHWGVERKTEPNIYQVTLGRALADAGADVVWGNHPHVLQGAEIYNGVPILYSMGNLISSLPGATGLARVQLGLGGQFEFFPATIRNNQCLPTLGPAALYATQSFRTACAAIQRKYPNPLSKAPEF